MIPDRAQQLNQAGAARIPAPAMAVPPPPPVPNGQPVAAPCDVRYPSTDPTARIVHCGLPWRHDGDHAEEDGAPTWPRSALAEAIVRSVAPTRADLERAELAAYERGVAEGRRQATPSPPRPVNHARGCACGINDAGQRFVDLICRGQ